MAVTLLSALRRRLAEPDATLCSVADHVRVSPKTLRCYFADWSSTALKALNAGDIPEILAEIEAGVIAHTL